MPRFRCYLPSMIKPRLQLWLCFLFLLAFTQGCLTAGHKELRLSLASNGVSGSGMLLFSGIHSESATDTTKEIKEDFNSLISDYYQGKKIEQTLPGIKNVKKRLFVDGKELVGEITFDFDDISQLGFYRYKGSGCYMYYTLADGVFSSGQFEASNGTYGGEKMPIVFWDQSSRDFYIKVGLSSGQAPEHSLLDLYAAWSRR